jgi:hypothetical protein
MKNMFDITVKLIFLPVILMSMLLIFSNPVFGQQKYHEANDMHMILFSTGHFFNEWHIPNATGTYPAGWFNRDNLAYYSPSLITDYDIILDDQGTTGERGVWPGNSQENNNTPVSIRKVWRYKPPAVTVDNVLLTPIFEDEVDPTLPADEMIEIQWVINSEPGQGYPGVAITQKSYSWVNHNHSKYIIVDLNYQYTQQVGPDPTRFIPDNSLDAWLATIYGFSVCKFGAQRMDTWGYLGGWDLQDDMATHMVVPNPHSTVRDELVISYTYDYDSPVMPGDDMGDPDPETGRFNSPQYVGYATLHTDMSASDESDDPSNPITVGVKAMDNLWYDIPDEGIAWFTSGTREENSDIILFLPSHYQATKQYHFEKDDDVHTVHVIAAASAVTPEEASDYGDQYISGTLSDAEKNAILATGRDSLIDVIQRAAWNWENNLMVPAAPPSPDLTVTSGPNEINLTWSDISNVPDPITNVVDFAAYRVYRAIGQRDTSYTMLWEGIANSYTDDDVTRGVAYHYFVTALDDGSQNTSGMNPGQPLESSRYLNRTSEPAQAFQPGAGSTNEVVVVPNPHDRSGEAVNYPGDITQKNKIQFFNLPPVCTIRIYTVTGKLIKTIDHTSGSGDESWDLITSFNQYVASGIYIFRIDDAKTWDGQSLESSFGKFIVIR